MKTSYLLTVSLICVVALSACSGSEPAPVDQTFEPISSPEPGLPAPAAEVKPPAEQFVSGQLGEIDMEGKTFVLKDAKGESHAFAYSETTKLTGGGGARDLRGHKGHNATVRYLQTDSGNSAVQIHVELGS